MALYAEREIVYFSGFSKKSYIRQWVFLFEVSDSLECYKFDRYNPRRSYGSYYLVDGLDSTYKLPDPTVVSRAYWEF